MKLRKPGLKSGGERLKILFIKNRGPYKNSARAFKDLIINQSRSLYDIFWRAGLKIRTTQTGVRDNCQPT
jgi:hypothetical protein